MMEVDISRLIKEIIVPCILLGFCLGQMVLWKLLSSGILTVEKINHILYKEEE